MKYIITILIIVYGQLLGSDLNKSLTRLASAPQTPCVAIKLEREAPRLAARIWGETPQFWPQRKNLTVSFIGGSESQRTKAWQRFQLVDKLVNLTFTRVQSGGVIRIAFGPVGHWSYVGTDCASVSKSQPTMNLQLQAGWFGDGNSEWDRVAIHEILHAIGMEHEHQHPDSASKLIWNKPAVYAYYQRTQGWSKSQIDQQVLNRYKGGSWNGTDYDKDSIMEYPVPQGLANIVIGWNSKLSSLDTIFLKQTYP